ncbi:SAMHD1 [Mytilus coruscus]|uniref:SAMHD1 n=1 Tax=Mytilus coruscus TaxID=42192 RepID=A0A6J8DSB4_MYTCO|nr:SAMHD1 [Mytilus coruscus]
MSKILNDPIHGTITLDPLLVKIIDTPQFQRLRNIKQLGGCYFVYPSASHNRFEHSIGTCFLASKLAHQLKQRLDQDIENLKKSNDTVKKKHAIELEKVKMTEEDLLCIEIAGLCHDIGHGPYSHLFDRLFNKAMKKKDPGTKEWQHEDVSSMMIDHMITTNEELKKEFEKRFPTDWEDRKEFIKDLIEGNKDKTKDNKARYYMYEIIANKRNEIDVDKMDYFARDCHGLGMKSNFDHLRFISQCRVMFLKRDNPDETTIAVRDKEEYNLYELFHTRIGLFRRAYYHKVNKAIELMLTDALVAANDHLDIPTDSGETVKMSRAYEHMSAYEKLTDSIVDVILMSTEEGLTEAKDLIKRIYKRQLYKLVGRTTPERELTKKVLSNIEDKLLEEGFKKDDFRVQKLSFSYGIGHKNPITYVYFYEKDSYKCFEGKESKKTSLLLPSENFQEDVAYIYSTSIDVGTTENMEEKWKEIKEQILNNQEPTKEASAFSNAFVK